MTDAPSRPGFQGRRQWTNYIQRRLLRRCSYRSIGTSGRHYVATENDACNGVAMLFGHLLSNRAQLFCFPTCLLSPGP